MIGFPLNMGGSLTLLMDMADYTSVWSRAGADKEITLLVTHASEEGEVFFESQEEMAYYWPKHSNALFICCHPSAVRERNPNLQVVGDWAGETLVGLGNETGPFADQGDALDESSLWLWVYPGSA